jgi:hypothetical protein
MTKRPIKKKSRDAGTKNARNENVPKVEQKIGRQFASKQIALHRPNLFPPSTFYLMLQRGGGCPRYAGMAIPPIPFRAILD